ncbi:hypothetical protein BV25DRAFT_1535980 [Artomyces pyxidatus]|uniref:Uncharacterized protein n=1 Tax=Artomyces pyxidatus TaxID=48021 RepID=A0ACB8SKA5_9AGAM|nr:hypothetical protein BV25DRAFT_1535980 [Artomyces pyxidatus]
MRAAASERARVRRPATDPLHERTGPSPRPTAHDLEQCDPPAHGVRSQSPDTRGQTACGEAKGCEAGCGASAGQTCQGLDERALMLDDTYSDLTGVRRIASRPMRDADGRDPRRRRSRRACAGDQVNTADFEARGRRCRSLTCLYVAVSNATLAGRRATYGRLGQRLARSETWDGRHQNVDGRGLAGAHLQKDGSVLLLRGQRGGGTYGEQSVESRRIPRGARSCTNRMAWG